MPNPLWLASPLMIPGEGMMTVGAVLDYIEGAAGPLSPAGKAARDCRDHDPETPQLDRPQHEAFVADAWMLAQPQSGPDWMAVKEKLDHTGGGGD